ncbi:TPA: hypothetical protein ACIT4B_004422 [Salmonella enterica subsp. enterica serovar Java]|uniref:hypothetical protein n=1 Tax=Salmonella enterica TaxID=28901 RepID=UPI001415AD8B|nr:hypothetical protein [Salmonella enterica]EBX3778011.1 hypothetical protein [Salmonella enterica subsp. enterica serovar Chester]EDR3715343.1 hypothetical protein [Salmonella enterica subsp. enterica serovar Abony]EEG4330284.1 hypothetical protein [Salmonella enterica subsp. enterica]EFS6088994.1 hypothetical protein [Salmonella enterica subsp. enterica serovar Johannesburg]EGZ6270629.1 hypothetical protein [Salmonella enterica subsp. enterica serovar 4,[5],12:b:-]HEC7197813.1 hypothetical
MKDIYMNGIVKCSLDAAITEVVKEAEKDEMGGSPMVTAIKNENGEIYRVITVDGLGGYMTLAMGIAELGLTDLHVNNLNPGKYDSLFVFDN